MTYMEMDNYWFRYWFRKWIFLPHFWEDFFEDEMIWEEIVKESSIDDAVSSLGCMDEPLIDVLEWRDKVIVVALIPGVNYEEINLYVKAHRLNISIEMEKRRILYEVELPAEVDAEYVNSSYRNGVLAVELRRASRRP